MLESYELPFGLRIENINYDEPELTIIESLANYDMNSFDKKIMNHVLCKNMDWCIKNKTSKNKLNHKNKNKTKKN